MPKGITRKIPSVLERFFELKIARHDGLSVIAAYHKIIKFQKYKTPAGVSCTSQKRGKWQIVVSKTRRDLKKGKASEEKLS